ncbi:hypothetical protein [Thalassoroseus pseudoceratinae]|uniref:hypothetical protein n=1 Tax=Thalassoroseus pseudoceratinae TaxID=2713176 RepID=UPI001424238B|nr:hypothetical protein [Thalassoroseus pseudoceratinae]
MRWKLSPNKRLPEAVLSTPVWSALIVCSVFCMSGTDQRPTTPSISPDEIDARRARIKAMSASDRSRLQQNLSRFLALPAEKQADLVELHRQIESDSALRDTKEKFEEWLSNLSPWQRQELTSQSTVDKKLTVVRGILTKQRQQREESRQLQQRVEEIWAKHWDAKPPRSFKMPTAALDRTIDFLEQQLPKDERPSKSLSTQSRRAVVLLNVLDHYADRENAQEEPIPLEIFKEIERKIRERQSVPRPPLIREDDKDPSRNVTRLLAWNVLFIGFEEILSERPRPKNHEELLEFVDQFDPKYRRDFEEMSKRSRSEAFEKLSRTFTDLYFEQQAPEFRRESERLRERMRSLGLFRDWQPRRGGRGPDRDGRGPGGPGGPDLGRGPGGGDRDGRGPRFRREGERPPEDDDRFRRPPRDDR